MQITDLVAPVVDGQGLSPSRPSSLRSSGSTSSSTRISEQNDRKLAKWMNILDRFEHYSEHHRAKLCQRLREGVPSELRARIWLEITQTNQFKNLFEPGVYQRLSKQPCKYRDKIELDLHRTFPNHSLFREAHGPGQSSLRNVMSAYSNYDVYVGYCQGMSFLAGVLLMELSEEDTFFALIQVMSMHRLRGTYQPGLPGLNSQLDELDYQISYLLPDLHKHLDNQQVKVQMYAPNWFITVFVYQFPLPLVLHIWDVFLMEGMEIVFRVALAVLKLSKSTLMEMEFEDILIYLRNIPPDVMDANRLILCALNVELDSDHLTDFFVNYHQDFASSLMDEPPREVKEDNRSRNAGTPRGIGGRLLDLGSGIVTGSVDVVTSSLQFGINLFTPRGGGGGGGASARGAQS